jgi:hypothetical protein
MGNIGYIKARRMVIMKKYTRRHESGAPARRSIWIKALAFVGLGALLTILFLLPGCGSDSNPKGAVSGKNDKTAARQDKKANAAVPLVLEQGMAKEEAGKTAGVKKLYDRNAEALPGGTREEWVARNAAAVEIAKSPGIEVMPGITREEMQARNAAAMEVAKSPGMEVMPGVTVEEMQARNAAALKTPQPLAMERMSQGARQAAALAPAKPPVIPQNQKISPPAGGK